MPKDITTTVYTYAELSDRAKERARDWYRECNHGDNSFADFATDELHEALKALGFHVDAKRWPEWSGFYSQGDGAAFAGTWYASDFAPGKLLADRPATWERDGKTETAPRNAELHRIAAELKACKAEGLRYATVEASRGFFMRCTGGALDTDAADYDASDEMCERFGQAARDLAHDFWIGLRDEYEYQNSDEVVAESITANEYTFTADGVRYD